MLTLLEDNIEDEQNKKLIRYSKIIKQNSNRLLKLINNLLDVTKIDSNSFELEIGNYDIVNLIRKITYSIKDYIEEKERNFEFHSDLKSKVIACDPFNIERVILNLWSNAIKFTDKSDEIKVTVFKNQGNICISVKDTGLGIQEDKQDLIFERFGQADKSLTRNHEGSGIGLTLSNLIIELHGGSLTVNSKKGLGSEFIIELEDKMIKEENKTKSNFRPDSKDLIDRIEVEFSDIYD